jgi:hypothetical protein
LLFLFRIAGFTGEREDLFQQVHDQAQDPEGQKGSSHADYHHGESEGPIGIVHVVLSENRRSGRALPDYMGIPAKRPFAKGIGIMKLLPAVAVGKILKETNGPK